MVGHEEVTWGDLALDILMGSRLSSFSVGKYVAGTLYMVLYIAESKCRKKNPKDGTTEVIQ